MVGLSEKPFNQINSALSIIMDDAVLRDVTTDDIVLREVTIVIKKDFMETRVGNRYTRNLTQ